MWYVKDDLQRIFDYAFNPDKSGVKTDESQVDDLKKAISCTSQVTSGHDIAGIELPQSSPKVARKSRSVLFKVA